MGADLCLWASDVQLNLVVLPKHFVFVVIMSSRTDPDDDAVDVTSFSALDVVEIQLNEVVPVVVVIVGASRS